MTIEIRIFKQDGKMIIIREENGTSLLNDALVETSGRRVADKKGKIVMERPVRVVGRKSRRSRK